jgi:hypothetical protein
MEAIVTEADLSVPATGVMEGTVPELGVAVAPEVTVETHVDAHSRTSTKIVVREPEIQDVAPIRSAPMAGATLTSHGGLEMLADDLVDLDIVARNMESMHRAEQWIKVCREYPE